MSILGEREIMTDERDETPLTEEWLDRHGTEVQDRRGQTDAWFNWCPNGAEFCLSDGGDTQCIPIQTRGDVRKLLEVLRVSDQAQRTE